MALKSTSIPLIGPCDYSGFENTILNRQVLYCILNRPITSTISMLGIIGSHNISYFLLVVKVEKRKVP